MILVICPSLDEQSRLIPIASGRWEVSRVMCPLELVEVHESCPRHHGQEKRRKINSDQLRLLFYSYTLLRCMGDLRHQRVIVFRRVESKSLFFCNSGSPYYSSPHQYILCSYTYIKLDNLQSRIMKV